MHENQATETGYPAHPLNDLNVNQADVQKHVRQFACLNLQLIFDFYAFCSVFLHFVCAFMTSFFACFFCCCFLVCLFMWVPRGCGTSRGQTRPRENANTSRNVAASDATGANAKTRTQVATSQHQTRQGQTRRREHKATSQRQMRLRENAAQTRNVAASQRQTRQGQTRRREDTNTSRNVAASQRQTRQREDNAETRNFAASQRQTRPAATTSQRCSVAASDATTRRCRPTSQRINITQSNPERSSDAVFLIQVRRLLIEESLEANPPTI